MTYFYPPLIAIATLLATVLPLPLYMAVARRTGLVDRPGPLKIHRHPTPLIGGAGLLTGLGTAMLFAIGPNLSGLHPSLQALLIALAGIWLLGLIDDAVSLSPWVRLSGQTIAALWLLAHWSDIRSFAFLPAFPAWVTMPVAVLLLVMLTNAMNLLDGIDGLATSIGGIAVLGLAIAASPWLLGNLTVFLLALFFACALLGVLFFNWHPARLFLGSNGALLIGFFLGALVLALAETPLGLIGLLCIVGLPLVDTGAAVVTRLRTGAPLFQGDRNHLYDQLAQQGWSTKQVVGGCSALAMILSGLGLALIHMSLMP